MSFWYHCEEPIFSFNLIRKSSSYSSYFSSYDHLCLRLKQFLWKCEFEKSAFRVSYSYSFGYDRLQKNVWKSVRNNMEVIENILGFAKKKKKNLIIDGWVIFHPYANFRCPYLKTGLCNLFPVLLECITHHMWGDLFWFEFCSKKMEILKTVLEIENSQFFEDSVSQSVA